MKTLMAALAATTILAGTAHAAVVTQSFDFGSLGSAGAGSLPCNVNCVIPGTFEHTFTAGGITVGAWGTNMGNTAVTTYLTQKPGPTGGGESGLGESDTFLTPSNSDFEFNPSTAVVLDNQTFNTVGYVANSIEIESLQTGEGAQIWGSVDGHALSQFLGVVFGGPVAQTFSLPSGVDPFILVAGTFDNTSLQPPPNPDALIGQEIVSYDASPVTTSGVPEPSTWVMMLAGLAFVGFAAKRRQRPAISIV